MLYQFDGTKEGFLTAFTKGFLDEDAVLSSKTTQLCIGQGQVCVETDFLLAQKAENRLLSYDRHSMEDLTLLLRSGMDDNEQVAFCYLRLLAKHKAPVGKRLAEIEVFRAVEYMKKIRFEIHRFHGFIRFMETASGALYAPFSPDNDICDLLAPYFKGRFPHFPFVIHDVKRGKATVYDGKNIFLAPLDEAEIIVSADEAEWQALWKKYYAAVNIPSRERIQQMKGYMPTRYWKFLPEKHL